jgi:tetratricopeptide (TPR) repeat protein
MPRGQQTTCQTVFICYNSGMGESTGTKRQVKPWVAVVAIAAAVVIFGAIWLTVGIYRLDREFGPARKAAATSHADVRANDLAMKLNIAGNSYVAAGMHESALVCYREALRIAEKGGATQRMVASYQNMSNIFDAKDMPESAHYYGNLATALNRSLRRPRLMRRSLIEQGAFRTRQLGDFDSGRVLLEKGREQARMVGDRRSEAMALNCLASVQGMLRHYDSAQVLYESCVAVSRMAKDPVTETWALHSLALTWLRRDQLDSAKQWLLAAIESAHEGGVVGEEASALFDIACIRAEQGDLELARVNAEQAFKLYEQAADNGGMNACRSLLAELEDTERSEYRERMLDSLLEQRKSQTDLGM